MHTTQSLSRLFFAALCLSIPTTALARAQVTTSLTPNTKANGVAYLTYDRAAWAMVAPGADYTDISGNPTGASGPTADVDGQRWVFPDRFEGTSWVNAAYPADYLTGPTSPLAQPVGGFALPVNTYGVNSFAANHQITDFDSSSSPNGYIGLGGSLRAASDFNEPGASVWWEHLAVRQDPLDSIWKIFATSGPGQGSVFELRNVVTESVLGKLHLSADYVFGNTDWLLFLQDVNGHLDTELVLGHIEIVPDVQGPASKGTKDFRARMDRGRAVIDYDLAAWATLASGFATPPVLFLDEVFDQAEANATDLLGTLSIDVDVSPSGTGLVYEMNGPTVVNQPGRTSKSTDFRYDVGQPLETHTGAIGLGGLTRWDVLPGGAGGELLFGDFTLVYDATRLGVGGSGWCLVGNIPPAGVLFDLINVQVTNEFGLISIEGDLGVSFELANFLFLTPSDWLVDVGDFHYLGVDTAHVVLGSAISRVGSPANPQAFVAPAGYPSVGKIWRPFVDHTSFAPTAAFDFVLLGASSTNVPGVGGTLLCSPPHTVFVGAPGVPFALSIPLDPGLVGTDWCAQGASFLPGGAIQYANAFDLVIGL